MSNAKKQGNYFNFLPGYFKWIGLVIMILCPLSFLLIMEFTDPQIFKNKPEIIQLVCTDLLILGLFLIAVTKNKIEDELTVTLRLRAMAMAFCAAIVYAIFQPIFDIVWGDPVKQVKGNIVIMFMLVIYLIAFFFLKKKR
ncbi:MAG TPA: hypothetical protein VLJ68_02025 [Chitinophagaceae bacterium]|nr:hypothetical protein [Chitinophagaceae bacterium]